MNKNNKIIIGVLVLVILIIGIVFIRNNNSKNKSYENKYTAVELLDKVVNITKEKNNNIKDMEFNHHKITNDNLKDVLGITEKEFNSSVEEAIEDRPTGDWFTESYVIIKVKDSTNVKKLANKIVANTEPNRFGCLKPDVITAVYYENYIMLIASDEQGSKDLISSFKEIMSTDSLQITRENNWNNGGLDGTEIVG